MTKSIQHSSFNPTAQLKKESQDKSEYYPILSLFSDPAFVMEVNGQLLAANSLGLSLYAPKPIQDLSLFSLLTKDSEKRIKAAIEILTTEIALEINDVKGTSHGGAPFHTNMKLLKTDNEIIVTAQVPPSPPANASDNYWYDGSNDDLLEAIPAPVFCKNTDHIYTACNEEFLKYIGFPRDELIGKSVFDIAPSDNAEIYREADSKLFLQGGKQIYETQVRYADDTMHDVVFHKSVFTDGKGQSAGLIGIILDISKLVEAENKLKESSKRLEQQVFERTKELSDEIQVRQRAELELNQVLSASPIGVGIANQQTGKIIFCNQRLTELCAPEQEDVIGELVQDYWIIPEQHKAYLKNIRNDNYVEFQEVLIGRNNCDPFWASVFGRRIVRNGTDHIVFWIYDLTQIKTAQESLEKSENELRNMLEVSPVAVCISEMKSGHISFVNDSFSKLVGENKEELIGGSAIKFWKNPADREQMLKEFKHSNIAVAQEIEAQRINGDNIWVSLSWTKLSIEGKDKIVSWLYDISQIKNADAMLKSSHDLLEKRVTLRTHELEKEISDRKKIEEILRESEAQFEASANSTSDWFWGMDQNCKFNSISERMEEITGISPSDLLGSNGWEALSDSVGHELWENYKNRLSNHEPFRDFKFEIVGKNISNIPVSISGIPIFDSQNQFKGYRGAGKDISQELAAEKEAKKLESQLHQSQKMEAIGQLTGGVAHDFNNILAIILGNVELAVEEIPEESSLHSFMSAIEGASTRGAQLTQRLLAYSRKQALHPKKADLNSLIDGILNLLDRLLGETIKVHFIGGKDLRFVFADQSQIENALMNLCINSSDSMPDGGELFIETGNLTVTKDHRQIYADLELGNYSWLSVRDTGCGMSSSVLEHAIEPFFTTKEVGKGTGLGLSMIYGFSQQSNGTVLLESEPEKGTKATLILPSISD